MNLWLNLTFFSKQFASLLVLLPPPGHFFPMHILLFTCCSLMNGVFPLETFFVFTDIPYNLTVISDLHCAALAGPGPSSWCRSRFFPSVTILFISCEDPRSRFPGRTTGLQICLRWRVSNSSAHSMWSRTLIRGDTESCRPIPTWPWLPCNPGKFSPFFPLSPCLTCTERAWGEGCSVFEMVYVNVAFIETSWDVIIVLLRTYKPVNCSSFYHLPLAFRSMQTN